MRDDDDYDDADRPPPRGRPAFPGVVMAAGIMWIGFGAMALLVMVSNFVMTAVNPNAAPARGADLCCACGIGVVGAAFLYCGIRTVTGKGVDPFGTSIGSLVVGLACLAFAALAVFAGVIQGGNLRGLPEEVIILAAAGYAVFGLVLILAGTFGVIGRSQYLWWRTENGRRRYRRRRDDDEDEEYEDERPGRAP